MGIIWTIVIGLLAGIVAKLDPGGMIPDHPASPARSRPGPARRSAGVRPATAPGSSVR
jgi:hypothetical protein